MIAFAKTAGTMFPTLEQHHLLRAALLHDRDAVRESFLEWSSRVHIDDADMAATRLFPLLYRNLTRHSLDHEWVPRLKGIYRQTWVRNNLLIEHGVQSLRALRERGIDAILLKGSALVESVYGDVALRPMDDFDMLVRRSEFANAVEVLTAKGWRLHEEVVDREAYYLFKHAVCLLREGGRQQLDLHWSTLRDFADRRRDNEIWSRATAGSIAGQPVLQLDPADQLLLICSHAATANAIVAPIRWIPDATLLIERFGRDIDWERLVRDAHRSSRSLLMHRALGYLQKAFDVTAPGDVLASLARRATLSERIRSRVQGNMGRIGYADDFSVWLSRVFERPLSGAPRRAALFVRFVRSFARETSLTRFLWSRLVHGRGGARGAQQRAQVRR